MAKNKINGLAQSILESESKQLKKVAKQVDKDIWEVANRNVEIEANSILMNVATGGDWDAEHNQAVV